MHGKIYPHDLQACAKLTRGQMLVYMALVLHSDQNRRCWPSQSTIAEKTGLSRMTVSRALRALEDAGHVRSTHRGGRSVKTYQLQNSTVPKESTLGTHNKPVGTVSVTSECYTTQNPDVTFPKFNVTFEPVDVTPRRYTNKEQKEHIINYTRYSLALGRNWPMVAAAIAGKGNSAKARLLEQFDPIGESDGRMVFQIPAVLDDLAEDMRPIMADYLKCDPIFVIKGDGNA